MTHRCSILVVAYQEALALPLQAEALDALRLPPGWALEKILVDGGSRDGTPELAAARGYRVVSLPGASIPVCRNRALAEASGAVLAFLDADCAPSPDWLEEALRFTDGQAPVLLGWPVTPPLPGTWVQRAWHAHWSHKNRATESLQGREVIRHEAFRLLTTRNMLLTRRVAEPLEGFDESLPTGEDTDFALRAHHLGIPVIALSSLRVVHYGEPATLRAFFRQQIWHANRASYRKIFRMGGVRTGGNAPLFTLLFLGGAVATLAGILLALACGPLFLALALPLPLLLGGLAARTSRKAGDATLLPGLFLLYGAYGLARSLDLLGWGRNKRSWKA
jgi:glycosyltransferase involved in cell wall biosynthesis